MKRSKTVRVQVGPNRWAYRTEGAAEPPKPQGHRIESGDSHVNQALGVPAHQREEFQKDAPPGVHYDQPEKHNFVSPRFTSMNAYYAELKRRGQFDRSGYR